MNDSQKCIEQLSASLQSLTASAGKLPSFVAPLTDLGVIAATGEEAAQFLHNQLTNDVEHLGNTNARLAGYCTPKGRLLASLLMWKSAESIQLQLPREILPAIQKRLQMFILRAKVKLADVSDQTVSLGLFGASAQSVLATWFGDLPATAYTSSDSEAGKLIRLADALGQPRYLWVTTPEHAMAAWPELIKALTPATSDTWRLTDIHAGIAQIIQSTQEKFVPQMINFEVVGGVNFKKGCYPGQEIVARSQYLGKLKRRMMLATVEAQEVKAGMEVFSSVNPEQPSGMIVNAERSSASDFDCLVELQTASMQDATIHLSSANGPALKFLPLPYALPNAE
jgi:folate-binding protein YgfZ